MKLIAFFFCFFSVCSYAEEPSSIVSIYHVAGVTCGKFISDTSSNPQAKEVYSWWLAGYITAVNLERSRHLVTDKEAHELWIKNYCVENPLKQYVEAVLELDKHLTSK
jgi:HdeA/HdeB family